MVKDFLNGLGLTLSEEKTLITNTRTDRAKFLGTYIKRSATSLGPSERVFKSNGSRTRIPSGNIIMTAPVSGLISKLEEAGFFKKGKPKAITKFLVLPIKDLIIRYNAVLNGVLNYYSFVDNRYKLGAIH
ncbi:type II intron maturase-domain-containing protein [Xylaria intraflava]|nr:type II intron maturase-domain-containing protein [Xylaria intraflava]